MLTVVAPIIVICALIALIGLAAFMDGEAISFAFIMVALVLGAFPVYTAVQITQATHELQAQKYNVKWVDVWHDRTVILVKDKIYECKIKNPGKWIIPNESSCHIIGINPKDIKGLSPKELEK